jgi:hypothetical protein
MTSPSIRPRAALLALAAHLVPAAAFAAELTGWAQLPAATFADGPTSGQFAGANPYGTNVPPYAGLQPVQGFSAVLNGPVAGTFRVMTDNGFGSKANSPDALLRVYAVAPDFKSYNGGVVVGSGTVGAVNYATGAALPGFSSASRIALGDPDNKLGFGIVASGANYPYSGSGPGNANIPVDPAIKAGRLLTGGDLDIESLRQDANGNLWFGDEFGPFLVKTDATGKVLRSEIPLPGVRSPSSPYLAGGTANLPNSGGFEGLALNASGTKLYTLLEGTVSGDPQKSLRINEFDLASESYTGVRYLYPLESAGTAIGDMTAVNDQQFLVIERNGGTATNGTTPFKKIFLADTTNIASGGFVTKTEVVDLMNIADPHDLNGDGLSSFGFPYVTIEDVLILDATTLLVINDNNFPYGGGRALASDNTEFLRIRLNQPLNLAPVPVPAALPLMASALAGLLALRRHR